MGVIGVGGSGVGIGGRMMRRRMIIMGIIGVRVGGGGSGEGVMDGMGEGEVMGG